MKFEFNFEKKHLVILLVGVALIVALGVGIAYVNPISGVGHDYQDIGGLPNPADICTSSNSGDGNCLDGGAPSEPAPSEAQGTSCGMSYIGSTGSNVDLNTCKGVYPRNGCSAGYTQKLANFEGTVVYYCFKN